MEDTEGGFVPDAELSPCRGVFMTQKRRLAGHDTVGSGIAGRDSGRSTCDICGHEGLPGQACGVPGLHTGPCAAGVDRGPQSGQEMKARQSRQAHRRTDETVLTVHN